MKKIYLSLLSVALIGAANSQIKVNKKNLKSPNAIKNTEAVSMKGSVIRDKATFYTNDFSNAGDWVIGNNASGAGSTDNWVIGTAGPAGGFAIPAITSTTAANGFALFDSDLFCTADQSAWIGNANAVDCSGQTSVVIEFENQYRKYTDEVFVQVSTDNTNWTDFQIFAAYTGNQSSANPELVNVNISSVAANQATVFFRFLFLSDANNGGDGCDYAWMIDDVALRSADANDLVLNKTIWGSAGFWDIMPYYMIPTNQITAIDFAGVVTNNGGSDQSDVVFNVAVPSASFVGTSAVSTLSAGQLDTLDLTTSFTPGMALTSHVISHGVTSGAVDATPLNNVGENQTIVVNNNIYARDNDVADGQNFNSGTGYEIGNFFDIFVEDTLKSIKVSIGASADVGTQIFAKLYAFPDVSAASMGAGLVYVDESDVYTITANDADQWITLPLFSDQVLAAGATYLAVIGTFGGAGTNDFVYNTAGESSISTSMLLDGNDFQNDTWYYTTSTPMIRLELHDPTLNKVNELANVSSFSVYPNPAANKVAVDFNLKSESNVVVNVTDLSGKVIYTSNLGNKGASNHSVSINTANFANGVYVVNIVTNAGVATERLMINK